MTAHRAAWRRRASVAAAVVVGALLAVPAPALAQDPSVTVNPGTVELEAGGGHELLTVKVTIPQPREGTLTMTVSLPSNAAFFNEPVDCPNIGRAFAECEAPADVANWEVLFQIVPDVQPDPGKVDEKTAEIRVSGVRRDVTIRVRGPERPPSVKEISGTVTDEATGEAIPNATVHLVDGASKDHTVGTDGSGRFKFTGDIAPGSFGLLAMKDGYKGNPYTGDAGAGQSVTDIPLSVVKIGASDSPSPSPSVSASASAEPSASASASPAAGGVADEDSGTTFFTKLMIVLGIILLLSGVGVIGFLVWRRFSGDDEDFDESPEPTSGPRGPRPAPGSHGVYRPSPTQVLSGSQATQVIRPGAAGLPAVGPRPDLADAPTMIHRPDGGADATTLLPRQGGPPGPHPPRPAAPEYGGRHSAPTTPAPTSGPYAGTPPGGGYGTPGGYGTSDGYGSPEAPRHHQPTSAPPPVTDQPTYGGYGPDPYTQQGTTPGYGHSGYEGTHQPAPAAPTSGSGYDRPGYSGSGYGGGEYGSSGYGSTGYGQQGYQQPGYGQPAPEPPAGQPGYAAPQHTEPYGQPGYGQPGYGQDPAAPPGGQPDDRYQNPAGYEDPGATRDRHSPERRRLDWLDD